jgi:hypothetical protein
MSFIAKYFDGRKVCSTLSDYPVYSPPFHGADKIFSKSEIKANFDYFIEQRENRIRYLANYLSSFKIDLRMDRDSVSSVGEWLYRYGGYLIPPARGYIFVVQTDHLGSLHEYEPAWINQLHGLNIIHDIAIFAGDYIRSKNPAVQWNAYYGDGTKYDFEETGFGQPCLVGLSHFGYEGHHWILGDVAHFCGIVYSRVNERGHPISPWDIPGEFVRRVDYLADPNPPKSFPTSPLLMHSE